MKLTRVEVRNYRSFFADEVAVDLPLVDGMNTLVGPNNCGKSNLLSAVALAMDPGYTFDRARDMPAQMMYAYSRVVLHFRSEGKGPEETLLRYANDYERSVVGQSKPTYANSGELRFVVTYPGNKQSGATRQEFFYARGAGNRQGDAELRDKLIRQFRKTCRFVFVRSGESLESLLSGRFREILHMVLRDHLSEEIASAEEHRAEYLRYLQTSLLDPLRRKVGDVVGELFPEMSETLLTPHVPDLNATLSNVGVNLTDTAETELASKGTGVRGGVMIAMLRYLAEQTRRSMVIAVEEPEAFLHPGAQEALRDDLEKLAERQDMSLLVTTHSPFIVSRAQAAQVVALRKEPSGRTVVAETAGGQERHASLLGGLFRDAALPDLLERVAELPSDAKAIVVVEGQTDKAYLEIAAEKTGRRDFLEGLYIAVAGGATKVIVQTVLHRSQTNRPVIALLDHDEMGKRASKQLKETFNLAASEVLSLRQFAPHGWNSELEAEDLWPESLLLTFVNELGDDVLAEKIRLPNGSWHIGLSMVGKDLIGDWLRRRAGSSDCQRWVQVLEEIRSRESAWSHLGSGS